MEPQASALAKLCAYCVFAALESQNGASQGLNGSSSRKRSRRDADGEVSALDHLTLVYIWGLLPSWLEKMESYYVKTT